MDIQNIVDSFTDDQVEVACFLLRVASREQFLLRDAPVGQGYPPGAVLPMRAFLEENGFIRGGGEVERLSLTGDGEALRGKLGC